MVHDGLGLSQLLAVAGPSVGSFQGVEWGINYPNFMKGCSSCRRRAAISTSNRSWSAITAMITRSLRRDDIFVALKPSAQHYGVLVE
jgi:homoserine acetyltransferase